MLVDKEKPFYNVKQVAEILGISDDRVRTYDEEKLVFPFRSQKGLKRLYSELDIEWLKDVRDIIGKNKMNIYSFKLLFIILNKISDETFNELANKYKQDDIWLIFTRMRKNPNFAKFVNS